MALARHRIVVVASIAVLGLAGRAPRVAQDRHDSTRYVLTSEYASLWKRLTPEASDKIRLGNYITHFDQARCRVRAWERANTP